MDFTIRDASISDAGIIRDIYGYYVKNSFITFTEKNPTLAEYEKSIADTQKNYPYLVVCQGERILGMAYASQVRHHDAYRFSVESTIYLAYDAPKHQGLGKALYLALEQELQKRGYVFMYGVITEDNEESIAFHKALGFAEVGHFSNIGYKFGQWKGIVWYCKQIGSLDGPHID